jgi:hypothetical protein
VLRALLWMYKKKDASGLVKVQSNKIRNSAKRGAFLAVMRSAGLTNTVPELRPWAVQVGLGCTRCPDRVDNHVMLQHHNQRWPCMCKIIPAAVAAAADTVLCSVLTMQHSHCCSNA